LNSQILKKVFLLLFQFIMNVRIYIYLTKNF